MGAQLLRNLQPSIKYCSRVRPPDYLKAKGKKGGKQNIGVVGLGRCTVPGQLVGKKYLSGLAAASTPEDFGFRLKSLTFDSIFLWEDGSQLRLPTEIVSAHCLLLK